jgi:hypothetical protein
MELASINVQGHVSQLYPPANMAPSIRSSHITHLNVGYYGLLDRKRQSLIRPVAS